MFDFFNNLGAGPTIGIIIIAFIFIKGFFAHDDRAHNDHEKWQSAGAGKFKENPTDSKSMSQAIGGAADKVSGAASKASKGKIGGGGGGGGSAGRT